MVRVLAMSAAASAVALFGSCPPAAAEPPGAGTVTFAIGKCYDPSQSLVERPTRFAYNCDTTGVMEGMSWTSWGVDGAQGTGTDSSIECQPNCAQGARLVNPIVVHAWNPLRPAESGCPADAEFYSDMTIAYPEGVPPWIKPGTTWDTGTDFVTVDGLPAVHFSGLKPSCTPLY